MVSVYFMTMELFTLCSHQEKGIHTQAQKTCELEPGKDVPLEHEASAPPSAPMQSEVPVTEEITNDDNQLLTHPFVKVKDTTYGPPTSDNVTMKVKSLPVKKLEVMYRMSALIYDPQVTSNIYS